MDFFESVVHVCDGVAISIVEQGRLTFRTSEKSDVRRGPDELLFGLAIIFLM
jgi:hypothetical protein